MIARGKLTRPFVCALESSSKEEGNEAWSFWLGSRVSTPMRIRHCRIQRGFLRHGVTEQYKVVTPSAEEG